VAGKDPKRAADTASATLKQLNDAAPEARLESDEVERRTISLVVMRVGDRWFGVKAATVREVVIKGFVTRLPLAPPHLQGLTLVHGRLVPVVSLVELFDGVQPGESGQMLPRLVVVTSGGAEVALVTEEAQGVLELEMEVSGKVGALAGVSVLAEVEWEGRMLAILDSATLVEGALAR